MSRGKSIRIFLADGTVTGIRHAEVVNWTGQAIACPRNRIAELAEWEESKRPGVYILFGFDEEESEALAYIGEAENVYDRLKSHLANKEFWNEVVLFTNKDENLTKAHVKYLESRFIQLAVTAKRYKLENGNIPQPPLLPRGDKESMEEFIEQARGLIGVLGHKILEPIIQMSGELYVASDVAPYITGEGEKELTGTKLYLKVKNIHAEAIVADEGIVVLAGSDAAMNVMDSLSVGYIKLRKKLIDLGVLVESGGMLKFSKDYLFPNPSPAAAIVVGYSINGRYTWKDGNGTPLKNLEEGAAYM